MKLVHLARRLSALACGLSVLVWQGCGDNTRQKRGGQEYVDAGPVPDAGDKSDSGSNASKDGGDDSASNVGSGGAAGTAGASGAKAGSGGGGASGRGASGSGGRGAAGKGGAPAAGTGGKAGAPAAGATAGVGAGGVAGVAGSGGVGGVSGAGAGASGTQSQAGAGGESGTGAEAGSGGEAGGAGSAAPYCGTLNGFACGAGRFCNFPPDAQCGLFDVSGLCEELPTACDAISAPVCGCDNRTHANACVTHLDGISVRHDGLCTREECLHAGGRPVLSDGASIPACDEAEQVWSIDSGGDESAVCCLPTQSTGRTCGGIATLECDPREFCNYEPAAGGQGCDGMVADAAGICQVIPSGCSFEYRPVCGCDKKTYSNLCDAHSYGASVLHDGACTELDCAAVAGRVVYSAGPQPMCAPGEAQWTTIVDSSGAMPIESAICCRQE